MSPMMYIIIGLLIIIAIIWLVIRAIKGSYQNDTPPTEFDLDAIEDNHPPLVPRRVISREEYSGNAQAHIDGGRYDEALEELSKGLNRYPDDSDMMLKQLDIYALTDRRSDFDALHKQIKVVGDKESIDHAEKLLSILEGETEDVNESTIEAPVATDSAQVVTKEPIVETTTEKAPVAEKKSAYNVNVGVGSLGIDEKQPSTTDTNVTDDIQAVDTPTAESTKEMPAFEDNALTFDESDAQSPTDEVAIEAAKEDEVIETETQPSSEENTIDLSEKLETGDQSAPTTDSDDTVNLANNNSEDSVDADVETVTEEAPTQVSPSIDETNAIDVEAEEVTVNEETSEVENSDKIITDETSPTTKNEVADEQSAETKLGWDEPLSEESTEIRPAYDAAKTKTSVQAPTTAPVAADVVDTDVSDVESTDTVAQTDEPETADEQAPTSDEFEQSFAEDFDFIHDLDNAQITLDLAEQYVALGEFDSAKRLVNEVLNSDSTDVQKKTANDVLARIN